MEIIRTMIYYFFDKFWDIRTSGPLSREIPYLLLRRYLSSKKKPEETLIYMSARVATDCAILPSGSGSSPPTAFGRIFWHSGIYLDVRLGKDVAESN